MTGNNNNDDYEDLDIQYFRLSSGEQIVSMILESDDDSYDDEILLHKPMKVNHQLTGDKEVYYFSPWQYLAEHDACILYAHHIITSSGCKSDIKQKYIQYCLDSDQSFNLDKQPPVDDSSTKNVSGKPETTSNVVIAFDSYKTTKH